MTAPADRMAGGDSAPAPRLSFDDPKPDDKRRMQQIFLRPSLREEIEQRRGKLSRSAWIERAIYAQLAREPR